MSEEQKKERAELRKKKTAKKYVKKKQKVWNFQKRKAQVSYFF